MNINQPNQLSSETVENKAKNKIFEFLDKANKFLHRQYKIDKFRFVLISILILILSSVILTSAKSFFIQKEQYEDFLSKTKIVSWRDYLDTLSTEPVETLQYNVYRTEYSPLGFTNIKTVNEIVLKDGRHVAYIGNLDEQKAKDANQIIYSKNIMEKRLVVDHGDKASVLNSMFGSLVFIVGLLAIIIMAQRAFADLLVGKNFELKRNDENIRFDDIIGYDEVKLEFNETVAKLKKYEKLKKQGINTPKGILLTGGPGVGKTMFAKALANEFGAGFLYATGADFVELYVGTGARRVRSLFANARYMAPCVIFIDEIDALGRRDGPGMDSERLSTINQMLAEMDGMNENKAILVIAATNHPDKVDPALLRPGRFDKKINIPSPDIETREKILKFYYNKSKVSKDKSPDFARFAKVTAGMSGAELKNLIDEAKNLYIRDNPDSDKIQIDDEHLNEALEIIYLGISISKNNPKELERVAVHELGHAIVGHFLKNNNLVQKISISGRGAALGFTLQTPKEELKLLTPKEIKSQITSLLAGRAAEKIILNEISSGAADDLQRANLLAQKMVCEWGMGETVGMFATLPKTMTDMGFQYNQQKIENDINQILTECYQKSCDIIEKYKDWLLNKKDVLLEKISLEHDELFEDFIEKTI